MPRKIEPTPPDCFLYRPADFDKSLYPGMIADHPDAVDWFHSSLYMGKITSGLCKGEFLNLHSRHLGSVMGPEIATKVWKDLEKVGLIECDGEYSEGNKSFGFRFGPGLVDAKWVKHQPEGKVFRNRIEAAKRRAREGDPGEPPVVKHLRTNVQKAKFSDATAAMIESLPETRYKPESEFANKRELARNQVDLFEAGFCRAKINQYGRVHTNFTSCCGELRQCLKSDGEKLFEIDLRNSQMLFKARLICLTHAFPCILRDGSFQSSCRSLSTTNLPSELREMMAAAASGYYYEQLMAGDDWTRDEVKMQLFRPSFGTTQQQENEIGGEWLRLR